MIGLTIKDDKVLVKRKNSPISVEITRDQAKTILEGECRSIKGKAFAVFETPRGY